MKIGIDISQIIYEGTGVARFTEGLTKSVLKYDKENQWTFFFSSLRRQLPNELRTQIEKRGHRLVIYKVPPTFLAYVWNSIHRLKVERLIGHLDWFITSDWTEPPSRLNKATIIHDLALFRYPENSHNKTEIDAMKMNISPDIVANHKSKLKWVSKESKIIFADSIANREDIVEYLKIKIEKIKVIYPGVETTKRPSPVEIKKVLQRFKIKNPFVLTVGKVEPRKNIPALIKAFQKSKLKNTKLMIAGQRGWDKVKSPGANIHFLGYVSDDDLRALYSACLFFIYPSLWEGFGYPVIEAMALGAAVATSNTSSLKEIGQDAALLFNPFNENEIKNTIVKLATNSTLRQELSRKGLEKSKKYSWKNYYQKLIESLSSN